MKERFKVKVERIFIPRLLKWNEYPFHQAVDSVISSYSFLWPIFLAFLLWLNSVANSVSPLLFVTSALD